MRRTRCAGCRRGPSRRTGADRAPGGLKATYVVMWTNADGSGSGYHVDGAYIKDDWTVESAYRTWWKN